MKKLSLLSFLTLLTLSVFLVGCGDEKQQEQPRADEDNSEVSQVEEEISNEESSQIDTSDWKTYRNEELGFEVNYPEDKFEVSFKSNFPSPRVQFNKKGVDCSQETLEVSQMDCVLINKMGLDKTEKDFDEFFEKLSLDKSFEFQVGEFKTKKGLISKRVIGKSKKEDGFYMDNVYFSGKNSNYYIAYFYEEREDDLQKKIVSTFEEID